MTDIHSHIEELKQNYNLPAKFVDEIRYELNQHIFNFGDYLKSANGKSLPLRAKNIAKSIYIYFKILTRPKLNSKNPKILSSAYFSVNDELRSAGLEVYSQPWTITRDRNILSNFQLNKHIVDISRMLKLGDVQKILGANFQEAADGYKVQLAKLIQNHGIRGILTSNDVAYFENSAINVSKSLGIPTAVFLHGLPGVYNGADDNRSEHLLVWGEKIKENLIKLGKNTNKIHVVGHPLYKTPVKADSIRFSLDDVLVLPRSIPKGQLTNPTLYYSFETIINYLYSVQSVLQSLGVRSARLRPHPSESHEWYEKMIDKGFYSLDNQSLENSLTKATLVIGPTSTVFLQSIFYGANYIPYEGGIRKDFVNLVPPFDGTTEGVPVAFCKEDLLSIIRKKEKLDPLVFNQYVSTPFNVASIKSLFS